MKVSAYSRRLRNAHLHGEKQKKSFFSQAQDGQHQPFFSTRQANGRAVQTKLTIGKAGDQYEQEADQVANKVVSQSAQSSDVQRRESNAIQRASLMSPVEDEQLGTAEARMEKDKLIQEKVQRMEEKEEVQAKPEEEDVQMQPEEEEAQAKPEEEDVLLQPEEEEVQAKPEEEEDVQMQPDEEEVQAKVEGGQTASAAVSQKIENSKGGGKPLAGGIRGWLERAFGADFSKVRIHTGADAVRLNKKLGAQAFTRGQDIFFNAGKYRPETSDGKRLLAHELTHVVQQCGRKPDTQQKSTN